MLISSLMGPIMGAGLGAAGYDFDLVKIIVHQTGDNKVDVTALKSSLLSDL